MSYKNFQSTDLIDRGIRENDMMCVRRALKNACQFDRTFSKGKFEDGLEYVLDVKGVSKNELYVPLDTEHFPLLGERVDRKDPTLTEEDFNSALFYLTENFCQERIDDAKKLGRYLFPNEGKVTAANPPRRSPQRNNTVRLLLIVGGAAVVITAAVLIAKAVKENNAKQTGAIMELTSQVEVLTDRVEELSTQVAQLTAEKL